MSFKYVIKNKISIMSFIVLLYSAILAHYSCMNNSKNKNKYNNSSNNNTNSEVNKNEDEYYKQILNSVNPIELNSFQISNLERLIIKYNDNTLDINNTTININKDDYRINDNLKQSINNYQIQKESGCSVFVNNYLNHSSDRFSKEIKKVFSSIHNNDYNMESYKLDSNDENQIALISEAYDLILFRMIESCVLFIEKSLEINEDYYIFINSYTFDNNDFEKSYNINIINSKDGFNKEKSNSNNKHNRNNKENIGNTKEIKSEKNKRSINKSKKSSYKEDIKNKDNNENNIDSKLCNDMINVIENSYYNTLDIIIQYYQDALNNIENNSRSSTYKDPHFIDFSNRVKIENHSYMSNTEYSKNDFSTFTNSKDIKFNKSMKINAYDNSSYFSKHYLIILAFSILVFLIIISKWLNSRVKVDIYNSFDNANDSLNSNRNRNNNRKINNIDKSHRNSDNLANNNDYYYNDAYRKYLEDKNKKK